MSEWSLLDKLLLAVLAVSLVLTGVLVRFLYLISKGQATATAFSGAAADRATEVGFIVRNTSAVIMADANKLDKKLDEIAKVGRDNHILLNSGWAVQLKINAVVTRRLADITGKPEDEEVAQKAERLWREHEEKQAIVDTGKSA